MKQLETDEENLCSCYAVIKMTLTDTQLSVLKRDDRYEEINEACMSLEECQGVLVNNVSGLFVAEQHNIAAGQLRVYRAKQL